MTTRTTAARLAAAVVAVLAATASLLLSAPLAVAASADTYDRFDLAYTVGTDGVAHVKETITIRFGASSGRHGLDRLLVTREPSGDNARPDTDVVFPVSNVSVTSPDPISTNSAVSDISGSDARTVTTRIRIGDANRTIAAPTATYVISYDQRGLLRGPDPGFDEFYVDALGPGFGTIQTSTVTVAVPGGVQGVVCYAGRVQTNNPCTSATVAGGVATFTQAPLNAGDILTIDAKITKGAAGAASRIYVDSATLQSQRQTLWGQIVGGVGALLVPLLGWLYYRPRSRDDRYAGMPPGTFPPAGVTPTVEPNRIDEVPVSFAPPRLPLAHAGYLLEGASKTEHLTATLIGLATAHAIQLQGMSQESDGRPVAVPVDARRASDEPSRQLYEGLFGGSTGPVALDEAGSLEEVRRTLFAGVAAQARADGWFKRVRSGLRFGSGLGLAWLVLIGFFVFGGGAVPGVVLWALIPITLAWLVTQGVLSAKLARGQRTAYGRAWTDQVEGFRTYLATAEAEQLKFEEGEDIFTRYLPWAVLFGLTERWTQVCERAIQLGLLAQPDTYWYGGGPWSQNVILWNVNGWGDSMSTATAPAPAPAASMGGTGFGGGSGFGGGGFSGGGSGGGGGGSW